MAKPWYQSKTLLVNLVSAVIMLLQSTELVTIVPPAWTAEFALAIFVLNMLLRAITTGAVTASAGTAQTANVKAAMK